MAMAIQDAEMRLSSPPLDAKTPPAEVPPQLSLPLSDRVEVLVEVCLKSTSSARQGEIREAVERMLQKRLSYADGPVQVMEPFLAQHVESVNICDTVADGSGVLLFWQATLNVKVFQLNEDGPGDEAETPDELPSFQEWLLPSREFHGLWESLIYDTGLKQRLLSYSETALLFSDKGVDHNLVSWNRVILLHGPPGTGKTSLCKALAQKLSIRFKERYRNAQLVEVNAHSLFSKWFSESGKLVSKLFQKIHEFVEDEETLVFVLIDEVESLAAARQAAMSGSEPSDSIRVVNALLTQLDKLKMWRNVVILTTSNITGAIDVAFVDRADIKAYVGPPTVEARYEILRSCVKELERAKIITSQDQVTEQYLSYRTLMLALKSSSVESAGLSKALLETAECCEGLSARMLRKLPFLAHASMVCKPSVEPHHFLSALRQTAEREISERR